jgi:hypothetical protein
MGWALFRVRQMGTGQLAELVGATETDQRDELEAAARVLQIKRIGSFIRSFSIAPQEAEESVVSINQQNTTVEEASVVAEPAKSYDNYLNRLLNLELSSYDSYLSGLSALERVLTDDDELDQLVFIPDSESKIENAAPVPVVKAPEAFLEDELKHLGISMTGGESSTVGAIDAALAVGGSIDFPQQRLYSEKIRRSMNVLSDKTRGALTAARETFSSVIDKITPSQRTVRRAGLAVTGLAMFAYAYNNISNPFETSRKQSDNKENIQAVAETPATAPLETAPTETTIEVTTTTPETIPATTAIEQTTTTAEVTTTTEEPSLYEKVLVGQADRNELSGNLIAQIDIPSLCLKGIDAYGSQTRDNNDVEVLDYFLAQGLLDETQYKLLLSPKPPKEVIVQFKDLFNPIYKTYAAETPQEACETVGPNAKYPPRWERTFIDSSDKDVETEPVVNYEPVVDVDWQKALPGEPGNVVIVGHRTTKSAGRKTKIL